MMKVYPEYKESGVDWLDKIPSSWFISDLRRGIDLLTDFEANGSFADVKKNVDLESDDKFAWYLRATDLEKRRTGIVDGNKTVDKKAYKYLSKTKLFGGELLVAKRGEIGKVYLTPEINCKATLAPNLYLIRLNNLIDSKFSLYWFKSYFGQSILKLANKSTTIGALYKDDVKSSPFIYPSLAEQLTIVNYLDIETARIDSLISEKENFIKLLSEKRQALISHVVTKGLNPNVEMKDSGIEWIGKVPETWVAKKLSYICRMQSGDSITSKDIEPEGEYPVYGGNGVRGYFKEYNIEGNYILIGRQGSLCGNINISSGKVWASEHAVVVYQSNNVDFDWFSIVLESMNLNQYSTAAALPGLSVSTIRELKVPFPKKHEQIEIASYFKKQNNRINVLVSETKNSIELLKEHRTALISAAVTGKIDVREVA